MNNFFEALIPMVVIGFMMFGTVSIVQLLTDYFLKKRLVEKGHVSEAETVLLKKQQGLVNKFSSLKWGLLILFSGVGLVLTEIFGCNWNQSALPYGILAISLSAGFLTYYIIMKDKIQ